MNSEQVRCLEQLEELLERNDKQLSEQLNALGQAWNLLTEVYEGDGAEEMGEMHQQIIAHLTVYEEQQRILKKYTATASGNRHES